MFTDIVKPENNEKELFMMAERLGFKALALYYDKPRSLFELQKETSLKLSTAGKSKADIIVKTMSDSGNADVLIGPEHVQKHSFYKELGSKNISLCFPLSDIIEAQAEKRVQLIENLSRNIRLCRKWKVRIVAATFASDPYHLRSESDFKSFFITLGMGTKEVKEAFSLSNR